MRKGDIAKAVYEKMDSPFGRTDQYVMQAAMRGICHRREFFLAWHDSRTIVTFQLPENHNLQDIDDMADRMAEHKFAKWFHYDPKDDTISAAPFMDVYMPVLDMHDAYEAEQARRERRRRILDRIIRRIKSSRKKII